MGRLDNFYQRVSRAVRRGQVFDEDIPGYARDAQWVLEDEFNWRHMWRLEDHVLLTDAQTLDLTLGTPAAQTRQIKSVQFVRYVSDTGKWIPIYKIQPDQVLAQVTSTTVLPAQIPNRIRRPNGFWPAEGENIIEFDSSPNQDINLKVGYWRYGSELSDSSRLLYYAEGLLLAQTILEMQPILRDDKLISRWELRKQEKLGVLHESQIENEWGGDDSKMVPYQEDLEMLLGTDPDYN